MMALDDRLIATPPYDGPNKEKLPTRRIDVAKLLEAIRRHLLSVR